MKKKDQNKGFTLVELIVVLVILAILAAILVPALLGYIDQAKSKQTVLNAKSCLTAAQAEMSNLYGTNKEPATIVTNAQKVKDMADTASFTGFESEGILVVGTKKAYADNLSKTELHQAYTITYVEYKDESGHLYYDGSTWSDWPSSNPSVTGLAQTYTIHGTATMTAGTQPGSGNQQQGGGTNP